MPEHPPISAYPGLMARRHSAAVYRRRRLVLLVSVLLVLAAVAAGVWLAVAQPWSTPTPVASAAPSATPTPTPTATEAAASGETTSSPSPEATEPTDEEEPGVVPCRATDVEVAAVTDAETYAAGELPKLSISLTNTSSADCTID